jgi:hypothetical protein
MLIGIPGVTMGLLIWVASIPGATDLDRYFFHKPGLNASRAETAAEFWDGYGFYGR